MRTKLTKRELEKIVSIQAVTLADLSKELAEAEAEVKYDQQIIADLHARVDELEGREEVDLPELAESVHTFLRDLGICPEDVPWVAASSDWRRRLLDLAERALPTPFRTIAVAQTPELAKTPGISPDPCTDNQLDRGQRSRSN